MSFCCRLLKTIGNSAFYPIIRIQMNSYTRCNFICHFKSDSSDIFCHLIWIFLYHLIHFFFVALVDFHPSCRRYSILLQENHCFSHIMLLRHLFRNLPRFSLTDSFNFCQTLRFFLHDPKRVLLKLFYNPCCQSCSDSSDRSAS